MVGIDCLVNRRLEPGPDARVLNPDERLSVLEAIRVYTYNGAYTHLEEKQKGSIEAVTWRSCPETSSAPRGRRSARSPWT
jgi:predicted amidohydrolase YtcJ